MWRTTIVHLNQSTSGVTEDFLSGDFRHPASERMVFNKTFLQLWLQHHSVYAGDGAGSGCLAGRFAARTRSFPPLMPSKTTSFAQNAGMRATSRVNRSCKHFYDNFVIQNTCLCHFLELSMHDVIGSPISLVEHMLFNETSKRPHLSHSCFFVTLSA
jgi:hypothetical protein